MNPQKEKEIRKKEKINHNVSLFLYNSVHRWLRATFGNASRCEGVGCTGKSSCYGWALKDGKEYDYKRENFIELCRSCHTRMDITEDGRRRISKATKGKKKSDEFRKNLSKPVLQLNEDGSVIKRFESMAQATIETGINSASISSVIAGRYRHTRVGPKPCIHYKWVFAEKI